MSPPKIPQCLKSPSSKSENGRHRFHPYEIQIQQAPNSSLPPHIPEEQGFETNTTNAVNELSSGLMSASSSMNQVAQPMPQSPQNRSSPYSQQQPQLQQIHQNVAAMHNWQGDNLGVTSQHYQVSESPSSPHMGPGSSPESYTSSYLQRTPGSRTPIQSLTPSSSYSMDDSEGETPQRSRVEPAAATNQNGQMLDERTMEQTVSADVQNSVILMDQNLAAMSGWRVYGQEANSQNGQMLQIPVLSRVGPGPGCYAQPYPQQAFGHSGPWLPSQHVEHSSSYSMRYSEDGGLPLLYGISTAGTAQYLRTQIVIQLPNLPHGQHSSILIDQNLPGVSVRQVFGPGAHSQNGQEPLGHVPSHDAHGPEGFAQPIPQQAVGPPCEISSAGTDQFGRVQILVKLPVPAAAEPLSIPVHQNAMPNVEMQCPLDPSTTFTSKRWTLEEVKEIEAHVRTASNCPHGPHPSLQDLIVTGLEEHERSTPLLMACLHGDLEAVKRIIEYWEIDLRIPDIHPISGILVENVTPLFVAASKSYSNIVRYLVENGAHVSSRTYAADKKYFGLMPLHAAVHYGGDNGDMQTSTVRLLLEHGADPSALSHNGVPMWLNDDSPDGQIITLLVQWGLNLSQRSPVRGLTPLHKWAGEFNAQHEDMSLSIVEMLLGKGADLQARDYYGLSVILTAAHGNDKLPNFPVLNFLLERDDISRKDKIDALELAGAVILGNEENHEKFPLALHYWNRALTLRAEGRPIYKTPIKSKNNQLSEWSTTEDLLQIEQDPSLREIQSLLVRLRILSSLSWRAVHVDYLPFFMEYLKKEVDENRTLSQKLDVSCATMEKIVRFYPIESELQSEAIKIMDELVLTIMDLQKDDPYFNSPAFKTFVELLLMTDLYVTEGNKDAIVDESHIQNLCCLFMILARRPALITEDMNQSLKQILRCDSRDPDGYNLLLAVCGFYLPEETVSTTRFLLKLGADPNVIDVDGASPLHCLAEELDNVEIRDATARLLLESGAHLDMVDNERKTPADVWLETSKEEGLNVVWNDLPNWLKEDCKNLTCLSARVIRDHQVPYHGSKLPAELIPFVQMH